MMSGEIRRIVMPLEASSLMVVLQFRKEDLFIAKV